MHAGRQSTTRVSRHITVTMNMLPALVLILQAASPASEGGARDPAVAPDGRLVVSVRGDLWIRGARTTEGWVQLTSGSAWDRSPTWSDSGASVVFASNRAGSFDVWRVTVGPSGSEGDPEQLTTSPAWEGQPTTGPSGALVFVRGRGPTARLWIRTSDGDERPLTKGDEAESAPVFSPAGDRLAYVSSRVGQTQLRLFWLDGDSSTAVLDGRPVEYPAWAPDGKRLSFTTRRGQRGVWVTATDGAYVNLLSTRPAQSIWSPDGHSLILAQLPGPDPQYNGDPNRLGDRDASNVFPDAGLLWSLAAPAPPDYDLTELTIALPIDRRAANAEAFDRVWNTINELYYTGDEARARRARWEDLGTKYRALAQEAQSRDELELIMHRMIGDRPPLAAPATGRAAVSSAHPVATGAGLEILSKGGNVVDAAIAVSFALGVAEPDASGIGGYGQMLIQQPGMRRPALIEFMTRAPEEASLSNAALLEGGEYPDDGPVLANVPGTVAGMYLAFEKYGSGEVHWKDLVEPAIRAADEGFEVSDGFATTLARERERYLKYEGPRALFFPDSQPLHAGDTLRNPDLAWTLRQIAEHGPEALYGGEVGRRMVEDLRGKGNAMRISDLQRYFAVEREPTTTTYRGHTIFSSAPPVNGGPMLAAMLNHLEQFRNPRPYTEDAASLHAMIEAWKLTPPGFERIADPALWPVNIEAFVSKDSARARWKCFDDQRALEYVEVRGDSRPCREKAAPAADQDHRSGTTSFAVADAQGNVVAVTQTLGTWGGNFYVTPGLGFIYNDKLTSYAREPDRFGARLPYARHSSSITPTIVFRGTGNRLQPTLATGAAGNRWITSAVYSIVTGVIDQRLGPQQAIELPRFLLTQRSNGNGREYLVQMEDGVAPSVVAQLRALGHEVQLISLKGELRMGYAAAVAIGDGRVTAGADPRRSGAAGAVPR